MGRAGGEDHGWVKGFFFLFFFLLSNVVEFRLITYCRLPWWFSGKRIRLLIQEMHIQSLGQKGPLEKETATQSSILAWRIPMDWSLPGSSVHGVAKETQQHNKLHTRLKSSVKPLCVNPFTSLPPPFRLPTIRSG